MFYAKEGIPNPKNGPNKPQIYPTIEDYKAFVGSLKLCA